MKTSPDQPRIGDPSLPHTSPLFSCLGDHGASCDHLLCVAAHGVAVPEAEALRSKLRAEEAAIQRKQEREAARAHNIAMAAEQARAQRREARANQLPRAVVVGQSLTTYHSALDVLSRLEGIAGDQPEDDALRAWIALVRSSLKDPVHELADALRAEAAQPERPLWWPA